MSYGNTKYPTILTNTLQVERLQRSLENIFSSLSNHEPTAMTIYEPQTMHYAPVNIINFLKNQTYNDSRLEADKRGASIVTAGKTTAG